jgi:ring-1,2-phenylacetyl-CoA epoxidase subunit PaaE
MEFYRVKIKKIKQETSNSVTIFLDIPEDLKSVFEYKPGQFLDIRVNINGDIQRRAYSISTSPHIDSELAITVKEIKEGYVSRHLVRELNEGDWLEVSKPLGKFTFDVQPEHNYLYVMFAGGSGITPIFSQLKSILAVEPRSKVFLVYSNRYKDEIIYYDELEELKVKFFNRFQVFYVLTRASNDVGFIHTRIDKPFVKQFLNNYVLNTNGDFSEKHFSICGPVGMIEEVEATIKELGFEKRFIHKELFTTKVRKQTASKPEILVDVMETKLEKRIVKIRLYGEEHRIEVAPDEPILTAAFRAGLDPPFSCQIGICGTCMAKLRSGKVKMDERDALTNSDIEQGFILTCQSHPLTDDCYIDYDY